MRGFLLCGAALTALALAVAAPGGPPGSWTKVTDGGSNVDELGLELGNPRAFQCQASTTPKPTRQSRTTPRWDEHCQRCAGAPESRVG